MEKSVVFRDNQELQANDFISMQSWAQSALDHIVLDAINDDRAYSGFVITKSTVSQLNVAAGRLYNDGSVYARENTVTLDLYNDLPGATKRYFAVVAWGSTVNEDVQPRNFLIDADTGEAEPQSVAMQETRYCNINYVKGTESADPQYPTVEAATLLLGYVLCDPTGILSIIQNADNQVDNLRLIAGRTGVLEAWRAILAGMVDTLRTDLGNMAQKILTYTPLSEYQRLVNVVADLANRVGRSETSIAALANTYLLGATDYFHDDSQSDTDGQLDSVSYAAKIEDGLRFPGGGPGWQGAMALGSVTDPYVTTAEGMVMPRPSGSRTRHDCSLIETDNNWVEHRILAHSQSHGFTCHHLRPTRRRWRCGPHYLPKPEGAIWWHIADADPVKQHLCFQGDSWDDRPWKECEKHPERHPHWPRYVGKRLKHLWHDYCNIPHWDREYTDYSHTGYHMVHDWLNSQDGWLNGITLFMLKNTKHAFNLIITECDENGIPDYGNRTLRRVVINEDACESAFGSPIHAGDLWGEQVIPVVSYSGHIYYETIYKKMPKHIYPLRITIPPVFLRAGQRYAFHIDTAADMYFAATEHWSAHQIHNGRLWHWDTNVLKLVPWLNTSRSLRFKLHFCVWGMWGDQTNPGGQLRYHIDLQPLLLAGGIGSIDILAESTVPEACELNYEVKGATGDWTALAEDPNSPPFSPAPSQLFFRAVFEGTVDLMPAVSVTESEVTLSEAEDPLFYHFSTPITVASTSAIKVAVRLVNYNESDHELDCYIHTGSQHETADSDDGGVTLADGSILRTYTFNPLTTPPITSLQVELYGEVVSGEQFFVAERRVYYKNS